MPDPVHSILSQIHAILSNATAQELVDASRYYREGSPLHSALTDLASAKRQGNKENGERRRDKARPFRPVARPQSPKAQDADQIVELILSSPSLKSKSAVLNFAKACDLAFDVRSKDSRRAAAVKLARQITGLHPSRRRQIIDRLSRFGDRQTEGWLGVIQGE